MATIDIARSHSLDLEEARDAVEQIAERLQADLGIDYRWDGSVLRFKRKGARGRIRVSDSDIRIEITLSMMLKPIRPKIESEIESYLLDYIG